MSDRKRDLLWPGLKVRAIGFAVGAGVFGIALLLHAYGYDNHATSALAFVGLVTAMLQFTFSDEGID